MTNNINKINTPRYITGFNGIRAIAVIGVILYHLFPSFMKGGYLGVPIFFTVSGYLITDLLRQEWLRTSTVDIKGFYVRRMKRLYPALITMLILSSAYIAFFQKDLLNNLRGVVASSLLYYNNWWQIFHGFSYFDRFTSQSPFTHIWSLAVEAQNYLVWPVAFLALKKYVKKSKWIVGILAGIAVLSAILMAILYQPNADPTRVYYGTDTRLFSIVLGSALAFVWPSFRLKEEIPKQAKVFLNGIGIGALTLLIASFILVSDHYSFIYYGGMFIISILSVLLVAITAHPGADLDKWLTNPVFTWLGKRSYGIYLYQFPIMIFYEAKVSNISEHLLLHSLVEILLILGVSELSYRFIEQPLGKYNYRNLKETLIHFVQRPFIQAKTITAVVMLIFGGLAVYGWIIAPSNQVNEEQQQLQERIEENLKKIEERNKQIQEDKATEDQPRQVDDPSQYTLTDKELAQAQAIDITTFGDSVILDAAADLQTIFPKMIIDGEVGRQLYNSTEAVENLKSKNQLKQVILVGLGTNGSFTEAQFDEFMNTLGSDKTVFWMNVRVPTRRWQNEVNTMLKAMEKKYENLTVIDWYDYSNEHEDWFYEDRVHPNIDGRQRYVGIAAKTIVDTLNKE